MPRSTRRPIATLGLVALALIASSSQLRAAGDDACYPTIDPRADHYVIGYGSLMDTESRDRTWPRGGVNLPARVTGYQRAWNALGTTVGFGTTFLGVTPQDDSQMVAALYRVIDAAEFATGDEREFPYCRVVAQHAAGGICGHPAGMIHDHRGKLASLHRL